MLKKTYNGHETETLIDELATVRQSGATNMLDRAGVQEVAESMGAESLAQFVAISTPSQYMELLVEMGNRR